MNVDLDLIKHCFRRLEKLYPKCRFYRTYSIEYEMHIELRSYMGRAVMHTVLALVFPQLE